MLTRRMKKLKEEEEEKRNDNGSGEQQQLSEEEQEELDKENEAMKQVLQIPLVVEEMMDHLKYSDFKTCRRVSSMWRENATNVILKKDCTQVNLIYDHKIRKFRRNVETEKVQRADYLSELIKLFRKSLSKKTTFNKFPCSTFTIEYGPLRNPQLLEFCTIAGQQVKTLTLVDNDSIFDDFRQILQVHCQNVETLHIYLQRFEFGENDVQFTLPKLRVLCMGHYCGSEGCRTRGTTGYEILKMIIAPHLEIVEDFNLGNDLEAIANAGKIHTLKSLWFSNVDEKRGSYPKLLQTLTNSGPQLESISLMMYGREYDEIEWEWIKRMTDPLQQLLNASKDTLKSFTVSRFGFLFENIKLPRFSKLTELKIMDLGREPVSVFPVRINLSETFPSVTTIDLSQTKLNEDENWDGYFPPPDPYRGELTSVTRVKIPHECSQNAKDKLRTICPNAEF